MTTQQDGQHAMNNIYLAYSTSHLPLSPLIKLRTGSEYSHIALVLEPNVPTDKSLIIESTFSRGGVNIATLRAFKKRAATWRITRLDEQIPDFQKLIDLALKEDGFGYDFGGAVGLGFNRDWGSIEDSFCTELVAFILRELKMKMMDGANPHWISTKDCENWAQTVIDKSI